MPSLSDEKIARFVKEAKAGKGDAFAYLYQFYFPQINSFILKHVKDEQRAQDAVQDVFLHALVKLGDLREAESFHSWLYRIAVNEIYASSTRKSRERQYTQEYSEASELSHRQTENRAQYGLDQGCLPELACLASEQREALLNSISCLTDPQQEAIILYYFADLSVAQVAELLGLQPAAVGKRLFDARAALRAHLEASPMLTPA